MHAPPKKKHTESQRTQTHKSSQKNVPGCSKGFPSSTVSTYPESLSQRDKDKESRNRRERGACHRKCDDLLLMSTTHRQREWENEDTHTKRPGTLGRFGYRVPFVDSLLQHPPIPDTLKHRKKEGKREDWRGGQRERVFSLRSFYWGCTVEHLAVCGDCN